MAELTIHRIHFRQPLRTGEIVLAEMSDDSMCILHDGKPCGELRWKPAEVQEAVKAFLQIKTKLLRQDAKPTT